MEEFKKRMYGHDGHIPTPIARKMMQNGIVQAVGFPQAKECVELIVECALHYKAQSREIIAPDGRVLANLSKLSIQETFGIPKHSKTTYKTKDQAQRVYDSQSKLCATNVNKSWLEKKRPQGKVPKYLLRPFFKEKYGDIILLLNRVMGSPKGQLFETWMYYFMDEITSRTKIFNWSRIISDSLHEQLMNLERTKTFHMISYIIYLLAATYRYSGLICKGIVGGGKNEFRSYDCYPQLQLKEKNFRDHDAFLMYITRALQGGTHNRLSHESKSLISRYGSWFIQFPKFTYIKIQGFTGRPYRFPIYPTNRMVLLEVLKQLETYQSFKRIRRKAAVSFLFFIGNMEESCSTAQAAEGARLEMQWYPFTFYQSKTNYDPHNNIRSVKEERFRHRVDIEDLWANAADEYEIRKRLHSRLSVNFIKETQPFLIPDQLEDNGENTQLGFDEHAPLPPIKWSKSDHADLATLMRLVMKYTKW